MEIKNPGTLQLLVLRLSVNAECAKKTRALPEPHFIDQAFQVEYQQAVLLELQDCSCLVPEYHQWWFVGFHWFYLRKPHVKAQTNYRHRRQLLLALNAKKLLMHIIGRPPDPTLYHASHTPAGSQAPRLCAFYESVRRSPVSSLPAEL